MSLPLPSRDGKWFFVCLGGFFLISVAILLMATSKRKSKMDCPHCELALRLCEEGRQDDDEKIERNLENMRLLRDEHKRELEEREEVCESRYKTLQKSKAGEECWARVQEIEEELQAERSFYRWRLKFCGAIKEKTTREIRQYERKIDKLCASRPQRP